MQNPVPIFRSESFNPTAAALALAKLKEEIGNETLVLPNGTIASLYKIDQTKTGSKLVVVPDVSDDRVERVKSILKEGTWSHWFMRSFIFFTAEI